MLQKTFGKVILMGEHSVVYGYNCIAIPFKEVFATCEITPTNKSAYFQSSHISDELSKLTQYSFYTAITVAFQYLNRSFSNLYFRVHSTIPIGSGLGSSAAVSCAIIKAIFNYYQIPLSEQLLYQLSFEAEKVAHINPSGIDNLIASTTKPIFFNKKYHTALNYHCDAYLVIIHSGECGNTKDAIKLVQQNFNEEKMQTLHIYTNELNEALNKNEVHKIGKLFNNAHAILKSFQLTTPKVDFIIDICQKNSLGAKMSGGGLGGVVIAICDSLQNANQLKSQLEKKGINQIWIQNMQ